MRQVARRRRLAVIFTTVLLAAACTDDRDLTSPSESPELSPTLASAILAGTSTNTAELPRSVVDTRLIAPTGRTIAVAAGGNLQLALDQAQPGDVITLQAGATFIGNFYLRNKTGTGWITIRTSASDASLPAPGTRITPSYANVLPKILSPNSMPVIGTDNNAHHYRLIGLEVGVTSSNTLNYGLVRLGSPTQTSSQIANNIILDRVYLHGHGTVHLKRCVELNSATSAVIDSYLSECHGKGQDTQAILGWAGPGPYKIENNHLEGAGENVMFGGADPAIVGMVPSDITIRWNYFYKPPSWKGVWTVKNSFEIKNAQRVLVEGNVFENNWNDAQDGFAIVWKSVNQDGACTWCIAQDITFRYNRLKNSSNGINLAARPQGTVAGPLRRVTITHNVIDNINVGPIYNGTGRLIQILGDVTDLAVEHNTMFTSGNQLVLFVTFPQTVRFVYRNNVGNRGNYGVFGNNYGEGTTPLTQYAPGYVFAGNVVIAASASSYPTANFYPATTTATGFVDYANANYRLASGSAYTAKATDGTNPGADISGVENAIRNVTSGSGGGSVPTSTTPTSPTPTSPTPAPTGTYTFSVPSTSLQVGASMIATASIPTGVSLVRWRLEKWGPLGMESVTSTIGENKKVLGVSAGSDWLKVMWENSSGTVLKRDSVWVTVGSSTTTTPPSTPLPTSPYTWSLPTTTLTVGGSLIATASTPTGVKIVRWRLEKIGPLNFGAALTTVMGERRQFTGVSKGSDWIKVWWEDAFGRTLKRDSAVVTVQ